MSRTAGSTPGLTAVETEFLDALRSAAESAQAQGLTGNDVVELILAVLGCVTGGLAVASALPRGR